MAVLTLPLIIQNHKKQVVVTKLKKTYAIIKAAENMAIAEYGDIENREFTVDSAKERGAFFNKYYLPYLKTEPCKSPYSVSDVVLGNAEYIYNSTGGLTYYLASSVCLADGTRLSGGQTTLNGALIGKTIMIDN